MRAPSRVHDVPSHRGGSAWPTGGSPATHCSPLPTASGADLLWRAKGNAVLPVLERFSDGSFRSELVATGDKRAREQVTAVRVIEYAIDDPGRAGAEDTRYRLLTTIADPAAAPADELAALYAQRWEIESAFDELKTHQRGPKVVLRSKTPRRGAAGGLRLPLIAAERTGVRVYAMEIDPIYVEVALLRWERFSGEKAVRIDG